MLFRDQTGIAPIVLIIICLLGIGSIIGSYYYNQKLPPNATTHISTSFTQPNSTVTSTPIASVAPSLGVIWNDAYPASASGYAISWPQCGRRYPNDPYDFGIIGVTGGYSFNRNPCLQSEYLWAKNAKYDPSFYINLDLPTYIDKAIVQSFNCKENHEKCIAYNYGYNTGKNAYEYALSQQATSHMWWLDVQITSIWSKNKMINAHVVLGAIKFFKDNNLSVGLSTTPYQWNTVVGDLKTNLPNWIPGILNKSKAAQYCLNGTSFSDGHVRQLAYIDNGFEAVYSCGK